MQIRDLEIFKKVYEFNSVTQAAEYLGYTQSAVSSCIKRLETELECPLFNRVNRGINPTRYGDNLYRQAGMLLDNIDGLKSAIRETGEITGSLNITCAESACSRFMPECVAMFQKKNPKVQVTVRMQNEDCLMALTRMESDFVLTLMPEFDQGALQQIMRRPLRFKLYRAADRDISGIRELKDVARERLLFGTGYSAFDSMLKDEFMKNGLVPNYMTFCDNVYTLEKMCSLDVGICLLPEYIAEDFVERGEIQEVEIKDLDISMYSYIYALKGRSLSPRTVGFLKMLSELYDDVETYIDL